MYQILFSPKAQKEFRNLDRQVQERVSAALKSLIQDPFVPGRKVERLIDVKDGWRLRAGDLRVLYTLESDVKLIRVYRIAKRGDVY